MLSRKNFVRSGFISVSGCRLRPRASFSGPVRPARKYAGFPASEAFWVRYLIGYYKMCCPSRETRAPMYKIVLLRHGESTWNKENRFTGWTDVDLSEKGMEEAKNSGRLMKEAGLEFDVAYVSVLKRALRTLWLALEEMDMLYIPWVKTWGLNERHYGALQGLNKAETAAMHGEEKVKIWRRSYDVH